MNTPKDQQQLDVSAAVALCISAVLLFLASGSYHPYVYYQLLRWIVCLSALFGAWRFSLHRWYVATGLLIFGAILFNPVSPIRMSRYQWKPYDLWGAVGLIILGLMLGGLSRPTKITGKGVQKL
jgi:hypothetical protein